MNLLKKIFLLFSFCTIFTACQEKEELPRYNLTIISESYQEIFDKYSVNESDTEKYLINDAEAFSDYVLENSIDYINSVTFFSDNYNEETVQKIVLLCKDKNIPVFFLGGNVSEELMSEYDKIYNITLDYTYLGECFASEIQKMWTEDIEDRNGNQIFTFSVVLPTEATSEMTEYHDSLLKNIELLGVPMEELDEFSGSPDEVLDFCKTNKSSNEAYIITDSLCLPAIIEGYPPQGEKIEILGIDFSFENRYANDPNMKVCFINYQDYFSARDIVLSNIENKIYPFENLEYYFFDKTIYLSPTF